MINKIKILAMYFEEERASLSKWRDRDEENYRAFGDRVKCCF